MNAVWAGAAAFGIDALKEGGKKTVERLSKAAFETHRHELLPKIKGLEAEDSEASKNLLNWWTKRQKLGVWMDAEKKSHRYKHGDEAKFEKNMTDLTMYLNQDENVQKQVLIWLGNMEEYEFNIILELLEFDTFLQWFKKSWHFAKDAIGKGLDSLRKLDASVVKTLNLDGMAADSLNSAARHRHSKGYA